MFCWNGNKCFNSERLVFFWNPGHLREWILYGIWCIVGLRCVVFLSVGCVCICVLLFSAPLLTAWESFWPFWWTNSSFSAAAAAGHLRWCVHTPGLSWHSAIFLRPTPSLLPPGSTKLLTSVNNSNETLRRLRSRCLSTDGRRGLQG